MQLKLNNDFLKQDFKPYTKFDLFKTQEIFFF